MLLSDNATSIIRDVIAILTPMAVVIVGWFQFKAAQKVKAQLADSDKARAANVQETASRLDQQDTKTTEIHKAVNGNTSKLLRYNAALVEENTRLRVQLATLKAKGKR